MPLRILHVQDSLETGGLENGVFNLIHHLDRERFEHCVCTVRTLGANLERIQATGTHVIHIGKREGLHFQFSDLRRVIRETRPDIVHSRNWGAIEAVAAARLATSCRVVHSEHGIEAENSGREPWRRVGFRRVAFQMADVVFCVSDNLRQIQARHTGFPARRMDVIYNGVDTERFRPTSGARAQMRRELNIGEDTFCVGCVGNLKAVKDHMTLLRALERLGNPARTWHVVIAGDGPERRNLEEAASALRSSGPRVSLVGRIASVPELLNALDVYVLPSKNEGLCNSLLEAMATGVPVIASDAGGNPEVVENGISGLQFPAGDAESLAALLLRLSSDKGTRERFGAAARSHVLSEFSLDKMLRRYEQLYEGLAPAARTAHRAPWRMGTASGYFQKPVEDTSKRVRPC